MTDSDQRPQDSNPQNPIPESSDRLDDRFPQIPEVLQVPQSAPGDQTHPVPQSPQQSEWDYSVAQPSEPSQPPQQNARSFGEAQFVGQPTAGQPTQRYDESYSVPQPPQPPEQSFGGAQFAGPASGGPAYTPMASQPVMGQPDQQQFAGAQGAVSGTPGFPGAPVSPYGAVPSAGVPVVVPLRQSGMALAALIIGIVGILLGFIPFVDVFAIILGIVGIILGVVGLISINGGKRRGKGLAIGGIILSVVAIIISCAMLAFTFKVGKDLIDENGTHSYSNIIEPKTDPENNGDGEDAGKSASKSKGAQDTEGDISGAHVRIDFVAAGPQDDEGSSTVIVTYKWKNTSDKNQPFILVAQPTVFQNGKGLKQAFIYENLPEGYDSESETTQLQPGAEGTVTIAYETQDSSPITVEVKGFSYKDTSKVTRVLNLQ